MRTTSFQNYTNSKLDKIRYSLFFFFFLPHLNNNQSISKNKKEDMRITDINQYTLQLFIYILDED